MLKGPLWLRCSTLSRLWYAGNAVVLVVHRNEVERADAQQMLPCDPTILSGVRLGSPHQELCLLQASVHGANDLCLKLIDSHVNTANHQRLRALLQVRLSMMLVMNDHTVSVWLLAVSLSVVQLEECQAPAAEAINIKKQVLQASRHACAWALDALTKFLRMSFKYLQGYRGTILFRSDRGCTGLKSQTRLLEDSGQV